MSLTHSRSPLALAALVLVLAVVVGACSSSSSTTLDDAGVGDAAHPPAHRDASSVITPTPDAGGPGYDGTTGQACQSNADCKGTAAAAPGTNECTNDGNFVFMGNGVIYNPWPTPICMAPLPTSGGNCDAGSTGLVQFCDGPDATDPTTSPGLCLPLTQGVGGPGSGVCFPGCSYLLDPTTGAASAPVGCVGNDTCNPITYELSNATGTVTGFGICEGSCQTDSDCSLLGPTYGCQVDRGFCTTTKVTRTKTIGTTCTNSTASATSDYTKGTCFCPSFASTLPEFYCSSACVVGGTPCPTGFVCDTGEPNSLVFTGAGPGGTDLTLPGPSTPTLGMAGVCIEACSNPDGGASADGGGTCPAVISACQAATAGGPDCFPPPM
ncbi:MAG TPA: hypothetical protein VGM06_21745 [Polyangiaceae bacterium]|jgi:hypothetical protein